MSNQKRAGSALQNVIGLPVMWMLLVTIGQVLAVSATEIASKTPSANYSFWSNFVWSNLSHGAVVGGFMLNAFILRWAAVRGVKAGVAENSGS